MKLTMYMFCLLALTAVANPSPDELARRQARSVHLKYAPIAQNAVSAQGTVTVTETQTNSYYCILGWSCGYCGIQDKGKDGNILIFSVWDPGDPMDLSARAEDTREDLRAKVLYAAPKVDVARFGGEGTGARTITPIGWKVGEPVTVRIDLAPDGTNRTAFTCYLKNVKDGEWTRIATISTLSENGRNTGLNNIHSFVEDFWRNYKSAGLSRRAEFREMATRAAGDADWTKAKVALFTADRTPSSTIDAGRLQNGGFFLQTGGATTNAHARLWDWIR